MTRDETVALFLQGRDAWNGWAEKMLAEAGVDPMRRAETLSLEEWGKLCNAKLGMQITDQS